jgi:hypothetical protein
MILDMSAYFKVPVSQNRFHIVRGVFTILLLSLCNYFRCHSALSDPLRNGLYVLAHRPVILHLVELAIPGRLCPSLCGSVVEVRTVEVTEAPS